MKAALAAEDAERPTCKCHGEPMASNGRHLKSGRRKWQCAVHNRARVADHHQSQGGRERRMERYRDRKARGVCTVCERPLLSEALCWDCLNRLEANRAIRF